MKLFRVTLQGLQYNPTGKILGISYVVASDPTSAYEKLKVF